MQLLFNAMLVMLCNVSYRSAGRLPGDDELHREEVLTDGEQEPGEQQQEEAGDSNNSNIRSTVEIQRRGWSLTQRGCSH